MLISNILRTASNQQAAHCCCRHNAQLRQEHDQLKWQHQQQQVQLQRLLLQSSAPSPAKTLEPTLPPVDLAQAHDFFSAMDALGAASEGDSVPAASLESNSPAASPVVSSPAGSPSIGSAATVSTPSTPTSPANAQPDFKTPAAAVPPAAVSQSPPSVFSSGQRAVIVGLNIDLDGACSRHHMCSGLLITPSHEYLFRFMITPSLAQL